MKSYAIRRGDAVRSGYRLRCAASHSRLAVASLRALASRRNSSSVLVSTSVCGLPNFQISRLTGSSAELIWSLTCLRRVSARGHSSVRSLPSARNPPSVPHSLPPQPPDQGTDQSSSARAGRSLIAVSRRSHSRASSSRGALGPGPAARSIGSRQASTSSPCSRRAVTISPASAVPPAAASSPASGLPSSASCLRRVAGDGYLSQSRMSSSSQPRDAASSHPAVAAAPASRSAAVSPGSAPGGPQSMDRRRLGGFIQQIFSAWDEPAVHVPLELGRQIVYGAIGYARELGFEPHADFGRAAGYLGAWDGQCELAFGRDGKPMYISGPDDDGERIIRKLHRSLGDGNYDFVHMISG